MNEALPIFVALLGPMPLTSPHLAGWLLKNLECQVRFKALEEELERKKGSEVPMVSNFRARESYRFEACLCLAVRKLSFRTLCHTFMLLSLLPVCALL